MSDGPGAHVCVRRAVTSCVFASKGLQQDGKAKVRVEPGLFEWTKWVSGSCLPAWIPPADLAAAHFSVDTSYRWTTCAFYAWKRLLNTCVVPRPGLWFPLASWPCPSLTRTT